MNREEIEALIEEAKREIDWLTNYCHSANARDHGRRYQRLVDALDEFSSLPLLEGWRPTHRHVKRNSEYQVIGTASLQSAQPIGEAASLVVYRSVTGRLWARPEVEFDDGRFEPLPSAPSLRGDLGSVAAEPLPVVSPAVREPAGPVNCTHVLRREGKAWPRTCARCGLGPCPFYNNDGSVKR